VRRTGVRDAGEIESRLRAVFLTRGESPPPGLRAGSRLVTAATGRRGTRTARLLWMGARAVVGSVRWAWQPAGGNADTENNRAESRKGYRSVGVIAATAAITTVAAHQATGRGRLLWTFGAVLTWLATAWAGALVTAVTQLARAGEEPRSGPAGDRGQTPA
jgi:hypothetical protein